MLMACTKAAWRSADAKTSLTPRTVIQNSACLPQVEDPIQPPKAAPGACRRGPGRMQQHSSIRDREAAPATHLFAYHVLLL